MTVYEPDPDVVRWNLHLIDVCGINNGGSLGTVTHYDKDFSHLGYVQEGYSEPTHVNVENDEIIAHALQEELSRLSLEESLGSSHTDEEHRKTSVLAQDWVAPSRGNYNFCKEETEVLVLRLDNSTLLMIFWNVQYLMAMRKTQIVMERLLFALPQLHHPIGSIKPFHQRERMNLFLMVKLGSV